MSKSYRVFFVLCFLTVAVVSALTQTQPSASASAQTCTQLVELAMQEVGNSCGSMDRNSTCYGYDQVDARFATEQAEDFFSQPADRAALDQLLSIQTAPFNPDLSRWGVALMNVQANVPNTLPGQAVTFILMGDTQVENAVSAETVFVPGALVEITVKADMNAKIRSGAGTTYNTLGAVPGGTLLQADAVSSDGQWARIGFGERVGWVYLDLVADTSALATLPQIDEQLTVELTQPLQIEQPEQPAPTVHLGSLAEAVLDESIFGC
ncbi:MAG: hypothetical protein H7Y11_13410, partial [Armatimonadetes bacterium]|nr:hypothetical protein [Anaerolineae bacterium]